MDASVEGTDKGNEEWYLRSIFGEAYVKAVCETDLTRHHRALLPESGRVDTNLVHDLKGIECH